MTRLFAILALVVVTTACGESVKSLTSPTAVVSTVPVQLTPVSASVLSSTVVVQGMALNWELGEGCMLQKPAFPSSFVGSEPASARVLPSGNEVWGLWLDPAFAQEVGTCRDLGSDGQYDYSEVTTARHYLMASFVMQRSEWHYCQWQSMSAISDALNLGKCSDAKKTFVSERLRVVE